MLNVFEGLELEAIAATVSKTRVPVEVRCQDLIEEKKAKRLIKSTGFRKLSIADDQYCTSDLCVAAAKALFRNGFQPEDVGAVIFITQTADYFSPSSGYLIQDQLGLDHDVLVFDINHGCSGFVYGLYVAASLLSNMARKVLVCCGDTSSRTAYPLDTSMLSIAGDAGAAAIVGKNLNATKKKMYFHIESYGEKAKYIYMPRGAYRAPKLMENGKLTMDAENYGIMHGTEVTDFTLDYVPQNIKELLQYASMDVEEVDVALLHQANRLMVTSIGEALELPAEKVPMVTGEIGNVSSASIPVCFTEMEKLGQWTSHPRLLLSGFGIGMSIASAVLENQDIKVLETIEL